MLTSELALVSTNIKPAVFYDANYNPLSLVIPPVFHPPHCPVM